MSKIPWKNTNKTRTICEVHREIYDLVTSETPNGELIKQKLEEAYMLGKSLVRALVKYKDPMTQMEFYEKNPNFEESKLKRG